MASAKSVAQCSGLKFTELVGKPSAAANRSRGACPPDVELYDWVLKIKSACTARKSPRLAVILTHGGVSGGQLFEADRNSPVACFMSSATASTLVTVIVPCDGRIMPRQIKQAVFLLMKVNKSIIIIQRRARCTDCQGWGLQRGSLAPRQPV